MNLPHQIATLLYCFNADGDVLLLHRSQEPNAGLWSPPGGKLKTEYGESPYACACREAFEEIGMALAPTDLHLTGMVSEHAYAENTHWLIFLFEVRTPLPQLPPPHREGSFGFFSQLALNELPLPKTDREQIWPLFWKHRGGYFAAHCHCHSGGPDIWTLEES